MIVRVITDIQHEAVDQTYDYFVPEHLNHIEKGMRVIVPFGAQTRLAYVVEVLETSVFATKEIIDCLDIEPTIKEETFTIIDLLLETNKKPYAQIMHTVIPKELFVSYTKVLKVLNIDNLSDELKNLVENNEIIVNKKLLNYQKEVKEALKNKDIELKKTYRKRASTLQKAAYILNKDSKYKNIHKYEEIIDLFKDDSAIFRDELTKMFGPSRINTLEKNGVLLRIEKNYMKGVSHYFDFYDKTHVLTPEQKHAVEVISKSLNTNQTFLLKGVTGSGKTEVYLQIIDEILKMNKRVLLLVPEITLVGPMLQAVQSRFNETTAIYHSALSNQERFEQYKLVEDQKARIVIGTRKSVFLNITDLGLIIADEAHDTSYIQTEGVEYQAIDILKFKSELYNVPLILGTATPSIEQMYQALNEKYTLIEMNERATSMPLPQLSVVDMRKELVNGNTTIFSNELKEKMLDRLHKKEQILLLFNRKGYAPFVMCRQCSSVPICETCQVPLVYSKKDNMLKCRYCNYKSAYVQLCETCGSHAIKPVGIGIEYVEDQLKKHFPQARVLRMDRDTLTKKGSEEKIWQSFYNYEADILLGTQMIAKGFDFPKVTLAAILMADMSFKVPTFKASEEAYTLFTQLLGRSGRSKKGEAIIQAYDTSHYSITHLEKGYQAFYHRALSDRRLAEYEPFGKLHYIVVSGEKYLKTYQIAFALKKRLKTYINQVLGPNEPYLKMFKNQYRFVLTLKDNKMNYQQIFNSIDDLKDAEVNIDFHPLLEVN